NRMFVFTASGALNTAFNSSGLGLNAPYGVVLSASGSSLFISDTGNNRIVQANASTGALLLVISSASTSPALVNPTGIAMDSLGRIFVANTGANCVLLLSPTGHT